MTEDLNLPLVVLAAVAGLAAGWLHFRSLQPIAERIAAGDRRVILFQVLRLLGIAAFLFLCARGGALVLLAAAAGILAGRWIVLRRAQRQLR